MRYKKHEKVPFGLCGVCGHYGDDCRGIPATVLHKTPEPQHTPTPWDTDSHIIYAHGKEVANTDVMGPDTEAEIDANAAFIVKAVNAYESNQKKIRALVEAAKDFLADYDSNHGYMGSVEVLRSVVDKAIQQGETV